MRPGVSSLIPKQMNEAFAKLPNTQHISRSNVKNEVLLVTFFESQGIIHKEFVPPCQSANKDYYEEVLPHLVQRIRRVRRPQFQERGSWFLLHENARPHTAVSIKQFLAKQWIPEINQPPYSPDLSPADFFLFPQIKSALKGRRFQDTDIKSNITKKLLALHASEFKKCFQQFYERAEECVTFQGNYFEEY
jgi:histone-lysine N-methyltransferase SETMAR